MEVKYAGYIAQHDRALAREQDASDALPVPPDVSFQSIRGLSTEAQEKLARARPATIAQARRLPGMTPAAISLLLIHLHRARGARKP